MQIIFENSSFLFSFFSVAWIFAIFDFFFTCVAYFEIPLITPAGFASDFGNRYDYPSMTRIGFNHRTTVDLIERLWKFQKFFFLEFFFECLYLQPSRWIQLVSGALHVSNCISCERTSWPSVLQTARWYSGRTVAWKTSKWVFFIFESPQRKSQRSWDVVKSKNSQHAIRPHK